MRDPCLVPAPPSAQPPNPAQNLVYQTCIDLEMDKRTFARSSIPRTLYPVSPVWVLVGQPALCDTVCACCVCVCVV